VIDDTGRFSRYSAKSPTNLHEIGARRG